MRATALSIVACFAVAGVVFAQQPASPPEEPTLPPAAESSRPAAAKTTAAPEEPAAKEPLEARVHNLIDGFNQRHEDRVLEMASYGKAGDAEPGLKQYADPRRVEVELKDEQDRERTSKALAKEYADEALLVRGQEQSLQSFIAKRQKTLDTLSKRDSTVNAQDLEVAAENLAHQPGTEAQVSEIRHRLYENERDAKEATTQQALAQQEAASAQDELKRLVALADSLEKESKAYTADAESAHQNQLNLADRLEYYDVSAQAEDVLDQGHKATAAVHHLAASPEVQNTLQSLGSSKKADAKPDAANKSSDTTNDAQGHPEKSAPEPKE